MSLNKYLKLIGVLFFVAATLQRKWKSFRDCFARELNKSRRAKRNGISFRKNHQYLYYKQLLFLKKVITTSNKSASNTTDEDVSVSDENEDENEDMNEIMVPKFQLQKGLKINQSTKTKKVRPNFEFIDVPDPENPTRLKIPQQPETSTEQSESDEIRNIDTPQKYDNFEQIIQQRDESNSLMNDSEKMFLLSLVEPLKKVPEHLRLATKIELMKVIHNAQAKSVYFDSNREEHIQSGSQMHTEYITTDRKPIVSPSTIVDCNLFEPQTELLQ